MFVGCSSNFSSQRLPPWAPGRPLAAPAARRRCAPAAGSLLGSAPPSPPRCGAERRPSSGRPPSWSPKRGRKGRKMSFSRQNLSEIKAIEAQNMLEPAKSRPGGVAQHVLQLPTALQDHLARPKQHLLHLALREVGVRHERLTREPLKQVA